MPEARWSTVPAALETLREVFAVCGGMAEPLSRALAELVPHRALAILTGGCARSPLTVAGEPALAERVTSADLAHIAATVVVGRPWEGRATVAGEERPVVAAAAAPQEPGSLLVLVRDEGAPPLDPGALAVLQGIWDVVALRAAQRIEDAEPTDLTASRVAAGERARVATELTDAHGATLAGLLGTLRARNLDDRAARRAATDLAASALVDLRSAAERERVLGDEPAGEAFARLRGELDPLVHYGSARLEFAGPEADSALPGPVAQAARAIVRGTVLTMLEQEGVERIRVSWRLDDGLAVTVRDDGPGELAEQALAVHALAERARAVGGALELESEPGWGTRVLARLPLARALGDAPHDDPLATLNPRELEVLRHLARGRRNRQIADELAISPNTVKFHVANVLAKLGVASRGEAAVVARDAGLGAAPLQAVS
jgi:DNA-binding CsgD family transcriptional regulator/signal transduction histidine kinase